MCRLPCSRLDIPRHARTPLFDVPTTPRMQTIVIAAGATFDEVFAAVAAHVVLFYGYRDLWL